MRWPLRYQILLPFAGVMLLVLLGASLLNAYLAAQSTERRIAGQLRDIARTLDAASFPLPDPVLKQMRALSGAQFVVTAGEGAVLAASDEQLGAEIRNANRESQDGESAKGFASHSPGETRLGGSLALPTDTGWQPVPPRLGEIVEVGGQRYFHSALPVEARGSRGEPAVVHILYPEQVWREARWQAAWPPLAVGAAALVLVAGLALAVAGRLSRPILKLRTQLAGLARGDFQPLPLPTRDDEIRDLMASVNSLATQLRELEQAIQRAERLAILGQLSGGLVHHLRNDVTGARMAVQLHQRHCRQADQESMAVALRQFKLTEEHLQRFLADVPKTPQRAQLDLRSIVDDLQTLLRPTCRHRKVDLQVQTPGRPVILMADAAQVRQMLLNLVLNGIDAAGGASPAADVAAQGAWVRLEFDDKDPQQIRIRVLDSGPGVPAAVRDRLFEPLVTGKPEGIGLGLAVARQVAVAHGGSVRYSRESDTCFEVILPRAEETASGHGQAAACPWHASR